MSDRRDPEPGTFLWRPDDRWVENPALQQGVGWSGLLISSHFTTAWMAVFYAPTSGNQINVAFCSWLAKGSCLLKAARILSGP